MGSGERTRKEKKGRGGRASESEEETRTKRPESGVKRPREPVAKMAGLSMEEKLEKGKQTQPLGWREVLSGAPSGVTGTQLYLSRLTWDLTLEK